MNTDFEPTPIKSQKNSSYPFKDSHYFRGSTAFAFVHVKVNVNVKL